ncbi:MAG TPA: hypothetical protein VLT33_39225 [Labilithrix sp.]|nr:hypothetical protein [Labilithrix sp.]
MTSLARRLGLAAASVVLGAALSCGGTKHPPPAGDRLGDADAGAGRAPSLGGKDPWAAVPACAQETQYVYVIDDGGTLRRFDPPTATFAVMGTLACPGDPFSMAIDRTAVAWVVFMDGRLARVDTRSGSCVVTTFQAGQSGIQPVFGMGFSASGAGSADETLFVASDAPEMLATIDTTSLRVAPIAPFDTVNARAELTGTGDGRLFAAFEGSPYVIAEIDRKNGHVITQAPLTGVSYPGNSSNFAFAFWGGDFFLFVGPGNATDVFRYRPKDGTTTKVAAESFAVVGAGVSTCAPITAPR